MDVWMLAFFSSLETLEYKYKGGIFIIIIIIAQKKKKIAVKPELMLIKRRKTKKKEKKTSVCKMTAKPKCSAA